MKKPDKQTAEVRRIEYSAPVLTEFGPVGRLTQAGTGDLVETMVMMMGSMNMMRRT